ncbi:hypothetical protein BJF85_07510 [Saccharomonospora sp. CUA-673]|uniref:DUF350 domain-containing protein n=1 Tax=Saccharomonospora sp. CUA-673 TaxID=1904969 RepID=UPI0009608508|nr:DUF350 domain-containing protein [Saccharomonospora sp. CUA-673]OLT39055.1 hypothetical protein BJF85_07510 [Saccharomonospora sp. CUA-673]
MLLALPEDFGGYLAWGIGAITLYAIVGLLLMFAGFYAIDFTTPGKLSDLVRRGLPNAVIIVSSGLLSMAFIVVVAIWASTGDLAEGLITSLVFGFIGIVVQVGAVRALEFATRIDVRSTVEDEKFQPASLVVAAAHLALGLVVAVAIS